ncbi:hypothetical protein RF11_05762 [Thelohanellus kitauei]|uniref:Uncharacterized protein n=1 Tax=Thelohanellus kitauei TaxID=669202 RepID=A0A0C2M8P0_THEKT|nr:hypothetical protein RF11_05762 [Thelohanellus kitauei]
MSDSFDFINLQVVGDSIVIKIGETKINKNKHNRGHPVSGTWVHCGVERTEERRVFLVVPDRTEATLLGIIRTHQHFQNPEIGTRTNSKEAVWNALKYQISPRNRAHFLDSDGTVVENLQNNNFGWLVCRRKHSSGQCGVFLTALREYSRMKVYYPVVILMHNGLDPIGFDEPRVVHYENTFVYSIGQGLFKSLHEVPTKMFFIEWMVLCLEECQVSSVSEIRNRPI